MNKPPVKNEPAKPVMRYTDLPDAPGFWLDTMGGTTTHILTPEEGAKCVPGVGRYYGPVYMPARQITLFPERGDATRVPAGYGAKDTVIIAHGCNADGKWGAGFSGALSRVYPEAEERYREWCAGNIDGAPPVEPGRVQLVSAVSRSSAGNVRIANMITQARVRQAAGDRTLVIDALRACIDRLSELATEVGATGIIMPPVGTGLAGATWEEVQPILMRLCARGHRVRVFALPSAS